jgi:hypothetical protein
LVECAPSFAALDARRCARVNFAAAAWAAASPCEGRLGSLA